MRSVDHDFAERKLFTETLSALVQVYLSFKIHFFVITRDAAVGIKSNLAESPLNADCVKLLRRFTMSLEVNT